MTPLAAPLTDAERFAWLRLARSQGVGPRTFVGLLHRFVTVTAALEALPRLARSRPGLRLAERDGVERELDLIARANWRLVGLNEPTYPPALRVIASAPPVITVRGQLAILQKPMVALVGSRNASGAGAIFTDRLARGVGAAGFVVVSGLARGIDSRAHKAALETGTVAVLAGGQDKIYPDEHTGLADQIAESGAVISEMPLGWEPRGRDFPRRNRIVSGLALGTVVVEAARKSGSLITARFANEQGREVFAVPGSPLDPRAEGTNDLIRQGATLCTCADDVIGALDPMTISVSSPGLMSGVSDELDESEADLFADPAGSEDPAPEALDHRAEIVRLLGPSPIAIDDLMRELGAGPARLRAALVDLECDGLVLRLPGDLVSLAPRP